MNEAIGMIETKGYTGSVEATDAMAKAAKPAMALSVNSMSFQTVP